MKKKSGKSADHTYVFNTLTNFQYETHQTTGNGNVEGWFVTNNETEMNQLLAGYKHLRPLWASSISISASSSVVQCSSRRRTVRAAAPVAAFSLSKKSKWLKRWQKPVRLKREKEAIERLARSKPRTESVVVWVEWAKQSKLKRELRIVVVNDGENLVK